MDAKLLLCDFAEVSGGKLFISGAGIGVLAAANPTSPYRSSVSLAIMVMLGLEDTDITHKMTIELVYTGGTTETRVIINDEMPPDADPADKGMILAQFMIPKSPQLTAEDELILPMAIPMFGFPLPQLGLYYFSVRVDGREMDRATFRCVLPQQQQQQTAPSNGASAPEPPL